MQATETIRAWKDEEYRDSLTAEQRAQVLEHPAGTIEVQESHGSFFAAGTFTTPCNTPPSTQGRHC
jgi:mersacidin/lichenicidin family type 2 lantibiotic